MADQKKAVAENVHGDFFVDTTCINCDTCRQLAPSSFKDAGPHSYVFRQPANDEEVVKATRALLSCPTGSIGTRGKNRARQVMEDFPLSIDEDVYYCGFNSPDSYGANSFFVQHMEGNWLIDSPKFLPHLVKPFEEMGGIKFIFLTHRDDVADADKYAERFSATVIIHEDDADAAPNAEFIIEGQDPVFILPQFLVIPVPGHTRGHSVLLYRDKFLFTGDHLYYDTEDEHLGAFRRACWYSWKEQTKSMERLAEYSFEWVLAGHGDRIRLDKAEAHKQMLELVDWMKRQ